MAMPPDMNAATLFSEITNLPRPIRMVDIPVFRDGQSIGQIAIRILTQKETMDVSAAAERKTRELLSGSIPNKDEQAKGYADIFNNASANELLFRACRNPDDVSKPFWPTKESISIALTTDQISVLINHYLTAQVELGPIVGFMSNDEIEAWIAKIQEGGGSATYFLNLLTWEALKELAIALVSRLPNSSISKSSPSLPQDDMSKDTDPEQK